MLTKSDLQKIKAFIEKTIKKTSLRKDDLKNFATKDDLKRLREDIVILKDEILGELKSLREEVTVVPGYREMIEDHEERITVLENKTGISS